MFGQKVKKAYTNPLHFFQFLFQSLKKHGLTTPLQSIEFWVKKLKNHVLTTPLHFYKFGQKFKNVWTNPFTFFQLQVKS